MNEDSEFITIEKDMGDNGKLSFSMSKDNGTARAVIEINNDVKMILEITMDEFHCRGYVREIKEI